MSSREAFENWAEKNGLKIDRVTGQEAYRRLVAQWSWEAWQAATERAANLVSAEGPVIGSAGVAVVVAKIREGNE